MTKNKALENFKNHKNNANKFSDLALGGETVFDFVLDDLAKCLDQIHNTKEFSEIAGS